MQAETWLPRSTLGKVVLIGCIGFFLTFIWWPIVQTFWLSFQFALKRGGGLQPVAKQGEVAGTAPSGDQASERAADVRHRFHALTNAHAADRLFMQPLNKCQPHLDRAGVG